MRVIKLIGIALIVSVFSVALFQESTFGQSVVPNQLQNQAGNMLADGFDCTRTEGLRIQTVFLGSQVGKGTIISFAARAEPGTPALSPQDSPVFTVMMSTTDIEPGGLNSVFSSNVGPDETTVFQGSFTLSAPNCTGLSPCPFAAPIPLQTHFPFDPAEGNLLVEIIVPPCNVQDALPDNDATFDQFNLVVESVSADDFDSLDGSTVPFAVITEFYFLGITNVPTLSEWGLIAMAGLLGLFSLIIIKRRKVNA